MPACSHALAASAAMARPLRSPELAAAPEGADQRLLVDVHAIEVQIGSPQSVLSPIGAPAQAGGIGTDQKETDPIGVALTAAAACRNE